MKKYLLLIFLLFTAYSFSQTDTSTIPNRREAPLSVVWNYILGAATIISVPLTIFYGRKSRTLEKQKRSLDFEDMLAGAKEIKAAIQESGFAPEIIFTPGLRGATFANLLEDEFIGATQPVIVGITFFNKSGSNYFDNINGYQLIITERWQLLIPDLLFTQNKKRLLIVDDFALTGDFLSMLKKKLVDDYGFEVRNIRTATLATTNVAVAARYAPNFFWYKALDPNFYFPWGQAK